MIYKLYFLDLSRLGSIFINLSIFNCQRLIEVNLQNVALSRDDCPAYFLHDRCATNAHYRLKKAVKKRINVFFTASFCIELFLYL